jgi:hypothetical protein
MNFGFLIAQPWAPVYVAGVSNSLDPWIPELWAQESLIILEDSLVMANLVHRDFSDEVARFGDVVNTRRPGKFEAVRKKDCADVTIQSATATNVAVRLDQHLHTSFVICDGEESKGFAVLRDEYLRPAVLSLAEKVEAILLAQVYQFLDNAVGQLGVPPTLATLTALRKKLNEQKVPMMGRNVIITPCCEAALLSIGDFVRADAVGDGGTALAEGNLGRKFGLQHFLSNIAPSVSKADAEFETAAVNNAAGYAAGDTVVAYDGASGAGNGGDWVGAWVVIDGDLTPQQVTADSGTELTLSPGLKSAVVDDAVITLYQKAQVDNGAGYPLAECAALTIDGLAAAPQTLQLVSDGALRYGAMREPALDSVELDRPLEAALVDDQVLGLGPAGDYCFAFHRNALAMVMRPLAAPAAGSGALSFTASFNGLSMRVTITYDGKCQGHLVTVDMLMGVKVLDTRLGAVMLA